MSLHCKLHSRLYFDKAVQTESSSSVVGVPHEPDLCGSLQSSCTVSPSEIAEEAINQLLFRSGSAYKQPNSSGAPISSLSGGCVNNKTWLDYNRPSWNSHGVQRRVASYPDSASKVLCADSGRLRVVSLPEPFSLERRLSLAKHELQDLDGQLSPNREYPSDLPQTPSPPSSPDSVVIFGNETHVPTSFFQSHGDKNGWTTWANSPPRPIPALHGPSSLPYARCPSGAEGTVVEGDDLATKVWGLGSDEGHRVMSKSPQPLWPSASSALSPLDDNINYQRVTSSALARHRDAVIDLGNPSTFSRYPDAYNSAERRLVSFDEAYSSPAGVPGRLDLCECTVGSQEMHSPEDAFGSAKDLSDASLGKGLLVSSQQPAALSKQSNLNSTAPSFIPTYYTSDFEYSTRDSAILLPQSGYDLTPSSTASSLWSPVFQSVPTVILGDYNPRIYSPQTDLDTSITPQMNNQDFMIVQQSLQADQGIKSSIETFSRPYVGNNPLCTKNTVSAIRPSTLSSCNLGQENRFDSCNRPCRPSHQPRSISMAQKRLSSVVEENILSSPCELSEGHAKIADKKWSPSAPSNVEETEISGEVGLLSSNGK